MLTNGWCLFVLFGVIIRMLVGAKKLEIGKKIEFYRRRNFLTQEALAEKMNVSRQTIYKWEHNLAYPELNKLELLTKILNISFDELLKQEEKRK